MMLDQKIPLLSVNDLKMHFPVTAGLFKRTVGYVKAVDGVSFEVRKGETFGLVGESGCGKSTVGKCLLRTLDSTGGAIYFAGQDLGSLKGQDLRSIRRRIQMIYQDPYGSLDPRQSIGNAIAEGIRVHKLCSSEAEVQERVAELLEMVDLGASMMNRFPHEFSGGQRQRVGIARALALDPDFIICDEPVSALDVSIQAQIIHLLKKLQQEKELTYLFIGHDLSVVRFISDRIAVMYLGKFVEITESEELYDQPLHPYTKALISAVPIPDPVKDKKRQRILLEGDVPSPMNPPAGCAFCTRCKYATDICHQETPTLREIMPGHWVACHLSGKEEMK